MTCYDAATDAIKLTAEISHDGLETSRDKFSMNVLVRAVVVGGIGWTCLRKDNVAGRTAIGAAQDFCPLVALRHIPMPRSPKSK